MREGRTGVEEPFETERLRLRRDGSLTWRMGRTDAPALYILGSKALATALNDIAPLRAL